MPEVTSLVSGGLGPGHLASVCVNSLHYATRPPVKCFLKGKSKERREEERNLRDKGTPPVFTLGNAELEMNNERLHCTEKDTEGELAHEKMLSITHQENAHQNQNDTSSKPPKKEMKQFHLR